MPYISDAAVSKKNAYQRPYKSRRQRRESGRRKHDESSDSKFLWRIFIAISIVVLTIVAFMYKGNADREVQSPTPPLESPQ